ncbi:hypothetical protein K8I61_01585 [bacterium]|nr:hypothetical protein [bacterium]
MPRSVHARLGRATPRLSRRFFAAVLGVVVGLGAGEIAARLYDVDLRLVRDRLYYQGAELSVHEPDPNPDLLYRLKPGADYRSPEYDIHINALGVRGEERSAEKPPGVFRIACLGGSNTYGAGLGDDETWPTQLERTLNENAPGRFEVFNLGVSAYVGLQIATLAEEAVRRFDPDLVILSLTNVGPPAFLLDTDVGPYFRAHPRLWPERVMKADVMEWIPTPLRRGLMRSSALFRAVHVDAMRKREMAAGEEERFEAANVGAIRGFVKRHKDERGVALFLTPAFAPGAFRAYTLSVGAPVCHLSARGLPARFRLIHPPADVTAWYAENLAACLGANGLLPDIGAPVKPD